MSMNRAMGVVVWQGHVGGPWQMQSSHPSRGSAGRAGPESSVSGAGRSEGIFSALYDLSGEDQVVGTGIPFSSSL